MLVQPNEKEKPPVLLMKSGMDALLWLESSREECMRRALGRRYDFVNDYIYHLQDQPPLTTNAPLCERLRSLDEDDNHQSTLIDRWLAFDQSTTGMQRWASQFGVEKVNLSILNKNNADLSESEVFDKLQQVIEAVVKVKQDEEDTIRTKYREYLAEIERKAAEDILAK